jgi:hypothetical protein
MKKFLLLIGMLVILGLAAGCARVDSADGEELPEEAASTEAAATPAAQLADEGTEPEESGEGAETIECELDLPGDPDWPVLLCETFEDNRNEWQEESQDNPYARYTSEISDGQFQVDYTGKIFADVSRSALTWFDVGEAGDFALSVSGLIDTRLVTTGWGVAFRADDEMDSLYLFSVYNDGTYALDTYQNKGWTPLIGRRPHNSIQLGQANKVTILAEGGDFTFRINDQDVNILEGGTLEGGIIRLVVTAGEGAGALFAFDNVVLQSSPDF